MMNPVTLTFEKHFDLAFRTLEFREAITILLDEAVDLQVIHSRREVLDDDGVKRMHPFAAIQTTSYGEKLLLVADMTEDEMVEKMGEIILQDQVNLPYIIRNLIREKYDGVTFDDIRDEFMEMYIDL